MWSAIVCSEIFFCILWVLLDAVAVDGDIVDSTLSQHEEVDEEHANGYSQDAADANEDKYEGSVSNWR